MNILEARQIDKSYGTQSVLKGLDLTLEGGKIYGLIGRNGVGKTTLLGILTGQNTMDGGSVTLDGQTVWENRQALEHICFSRELSGTTMGGPNQMKVDFYLKAAALYYTNWDKAYAETLLKRFKVERKKKLYQLSKGQLSLVSIIIALASRCPFTILDEPVAGLDVVAREDFYSLLLEEFQATGRTFLLSTHIIEEAAAVFEEVLFLGQGKIVEQAPTEELVEQFRYVSGHEDVVRQAVAGLNVVEETHLGRRLTCTVRGQPHQLAALSNHDVDVSHLNLQKVFLAICGDQGVEV